MNIATITHLIKKDLNVFKVYYISISVLMLIVSMLVVVANTNMLRIFAGSGSSIAIIAIYTFMLERKNGSAWFHIASLPVTRIEINTARFLTVLLISVVNLIIWIIAYHSILYFVIESTEHTASIAIIVYAFMNILIYLALYFIFYYRVNNIVIMMVYIIPVLAINFIDPSDSSFAEFIIGDSYRFGLFCGFSILLFTGAYLYSNYYFKNKEL
ncbi:MAG: hypothetical protein COB60_11595 [Flavobacteriaceae bacterium]|nr:MAG: hypothetical protein COB60_11595 [Flavobacteriaceae bacterium]